MGISDKTVEVSLNSANIEIYKNAGYYIPQVYNENKKRYTCPKGTKININIEDLNHGSSAIVTAECDYCGIKKQMTYKDYTKSLRNNDEVKKYCCFSCGYLKKREINEYRTSNNTINNKTKGYWTIEVNRISEFNRYIEKYKTLDHIDSNPEGKRLAGCIRGYENGGIKGMAIRLGYDINILYSNKRTRKEGMLIEDIIEKINVFVDEYNRFPTQYEFKKTLKIPMSQINRYGGINKVKDIMKYNDEDDLIDDSGFRNRSGYEYLVSQYLIHNNIEYLREQNPFKTEGNYRSDFTFVLSDGSKIECEIWGYPKTDMSKRGIEYTKNKNKKIELYDKHNINVISIEYNMFQQPYLDIQNYLKSVFSKYLGRDLCIIDIHKILVPNKLSNEEIFNEVMKYSTDNYTLPNTEKLRNESPNLLYEITKRYKHYSLFANEFSYCSAYHQLATGKSQDTKFWSDEKIYSVFDKMIYTYGRILNRSSALKLQTDDLEIKRVNAITMVNGGMIKYRLQYYNNMLNSNKIIPVSEIEFLKEIARLKRTAIKPSPEHQIHEAFRILKICEAI